LVKGRLRSVEGRRVRETASDLIAVQLGSTLHEPIRLDLAATSPKWVVSPIRNPDFKGLNLVVGLGAVRKETEAGAAIAIARWPSPEKRNFEAWKAGAA
jgi:hypothetical protein